MKLKIAQVVGLNTDQKAAQVTSSQRGENTFLAVIDLISDDAFTKGRQILSELVDFYFDFEGTPAEKLTATFTEAEKKMPEGAEFNLCISTICGKVLYLIGKGQVEVYLKRENKLSALLSIGSPSQLISGFVSPSDRLFFSTSSLTAFLGTDLDKSLELPIEVFEEEVGSKIGGSDLDKQNLAALMIEVAEESPQVDAFSSQEDLSFEEEKPSVRMPSIKIKEKALYLIKKLSVYFPKSGRGRLIIAVVLLVVILLGVGYKYKLGRDQKIKTQFNQAFQQARDDFNAAKGLINLNPAEAKNKLDSAKSNINKALLLSKDSSALDLKKQIENETPNILQQSSIDNFPLFLDLDLVKKNFRATQMSLSKDKLLILDPAVKTLVLIDLSKKSNKILAGSEQLGDAVFASLNGGLAFVYSQDKGVSKIDTVSSKLTIISKKDSGWGKIQDIYGFSGNVYLLDKGNSERVEGQIWKYLPASAGYSDKREYLSKTTKADLSSTLRMQIESSVYLLKSSGEILRFTKGEKDNFSLSGLPSNIKDPKSIFTSSDADNLYVLDSGNSRMLILTKTGGFKGEISGAKFASATDLVVDEVGKKVYLLEGSKIYSVDLK